MTVQKKGTKWATVHCHGKNKGRTIATFKTKEEAMAQHKAIEASKKRTILHGR